MDFTETAWVADKFNVSFSTKLITRFILLWQCFHRPPVFR